MQHRRVIRLAGQIAGGLAVLVALWWGGAWLGNHMTTWGIGLCLLAIFVIFGAMLRDRHYRA